MKATTFFRLIVLLFFAITSLQALTIVSDTIAIIKHHVKDDKKTLIIFDIDNTIAYAEGRATDFWFSAMVSEGIKRGMPELVAVKTVLPHYITAHETTPVHPVEEHGPAFIRSLQAQNIPVIALTSRSLPMIEHTFRQLNSLSIDFSLTAPTKETLDFSLFEPARFANGIMFCGNNNKAHALAALLEKTNFKPEKIIYADDKEKYLKLVDQFAQSKNIEFVGIRASTLDQKVASFVLDEESKQLLAH